VGYHNWIDQERPEEMRQEMMGMQQLLVESRRDLLDGMYAAMRHQKNQK
jgi:hypothetical protein